jgi:hypothetical protein
MNQKPLGSSLLLLDDILLSTKRHTSSLKIATLFGTGHVLRRLARLPSRRTKILKAIRILKHLLHLLQRLTRRLGEQQEDVDEHGRVEDGKHDVRAPLDVGKRLGHEQPQRRVEGPVERGAQRDALAAQLEREELGRVDPGGRAHGDGEGGDEEVGAGDEAAGGRARDAHGLGGDAVDAALDDLAMLGEDAGVGGHPGAHEEDTDEEGRATAPAVHPRGVSVYCYMLTLFSSKVTYQIRAGTVERTLIT